MAVRTFTDSAGIEWRVWDTRPQARDLVAPELRDGWLTFESELGKFRPAPVLERWQTYSAEKLGLLSRLARSARGTFAHWQDMDEEAQADLP